MYRRGAGDSRKEGVGASVIAGVDAPPVPDPVSLAKAVADHVYKY